MERGGGGSVTAKFYTMNERSECTQNIPDGVGISSLALVFVGAQHWLRY